MYASEVDFRFNQTHTREKDMLSYTIHILHMYIIGYYFNQVNFHFQLKVLVCFEV